MSPRPPRTPGAPASRNPPTPSFAARAWHGLATFGQHHPGLAVLLLLALYAVLALLAFQPQPHDGGDNAGYVALGRSLLERHAYLDLYDPAEPLHTKYPPVFPLIIAGALALGIGTWVGIKLIVLALGGVAVAATFLWLRRRRRPADGLVVAGLLAMSPGVLQEVHWELSDVPFWAFTALALWAFERLRPNDTSRFAIALLATVLAYFTRSAGLPLAVAAVGWLAWRRHWRQLLAFLIVIVPLAFAWWWRAQAAGVGAGYAAEFWLIDPYQPELGRAGAADLAARLVDNLRLYGTINAPYVIFGNPGWVFVGAVLVITALALYGWIRRLRRARVAELFLPLYLGLIFLWPAVWATDRFLLPVLGLVLAYAGAGLARSVRALSRRAAPALAGVAVLLLVALSAPATVAHARLGYACTTAYLAGDPYPCTIGPSQEFFAMAEWSGTALPKTTVVLSRKPRLFYVLSGGLKSRNYPMDPTIEALLAAADSAGARFLVFDRLGGVAQRYLAPAMLERIGAFCLAQSTGPEGTILFGIRRDAASIPNAPADPEAFFDPCTSEMLGVPGF